jgi:hypothetical protein
VTLLPKLAETLRPWIDPAIRALLAAAAMAAITFLLSLVFNVKQPFRIARVRIVFPKEQTVRKRKAKWRRHLLLLSKSLRAGKESDDERIQRFFLWTTGAFMMTYLLLGFWTGILEVRHLSVARLTDRWLLLVSLWAAAFPYGFMRLKLHGVRVRNSYDLVPAVNTLLLKYGEYRGNLYYAVFDTVKELKGDIMVSFASLLPVLQGSAGTNLEESVELFVFRVRTHWAVQLGILIHKAEEQGDNIELGLRWLIADMSEVAKITEEIKSENREAVQLGYLPVILLPLVIFLNQYPSMGKSWYYYFHHPAGIRLLIFTVLFTAFCGLAAFIIQKPRNEM